MRILYRAIARSVALVTLVSLPAVHGQCAAATGSCGPSITCASLGFPTYCCSQWGYCGTGAAYCGTCCQNGPCTSGPSPTSPPPPPPSPPSPSPPPPSPPSGFNYNANHGEDSRLVAYVGNWQACPTPSQYDAYTHLVIAFAVSYTWAPTKNNCDQQCAIASTVPICNNLNNQALVDTWRAAGKKVILSFGGAGMGGSWSGDQNNCWDYCFGKEEQLATNLVSIINNQKFDGIDIDYEYCYDINGSQAGRCPQRSASYTDLKAQTFLDSLTSKLRVKLDALQVTNGYNRGRYELTHAPMDSDLTPSTSKYFQILKARRADLDFLLPQFYNGVTKAHVDGFGGSGAGAMSAASLFSSLANDLFNMEPNKVVFGFCVSDCSATGSNANAAQAVKVMSDLKIYNNGQFSCNGGAFFWKPTTPKPTTAIPTAALPTAGSSNQPTANPTSTSLIISRDNRCGKSEIDARETCGPICASQNDCPSGTSCCTVIENFCGSILDGLTPIRSAIKASERHATECTELLWFTVYLNSSDGYRLMKYLYT
ncbi:hypothetical protein ACHAW5_005612 [Stephanodiscus triporus]|uniref:Chitinase n=1 Tax=Stephanodiscus triporus TaxID=2934178 RepID=A0ABD3NV12_9STRA